MNGFEIDVAALRNFGSTAQNIAERVRGLSGMADSAKLATGTFTQLPAGRRISGVHAVLMRRIDTALQSAVEQISSGVDAVAATADTYSATDSGAGEGFARLTDDVTIGASDENS